ncbi:MAG: T9SS type A sorting domain-containing protein [Flavobacteriales bacterium]|nr:T9SS type A sorting domain-containing protein [Flavobacteriales bacterium]
MNLGPYFSSLQGGDYHVFPDGRVLMSGAHVLSDTERGFEGLYSLIWFSNEGYLDTTRTHRYCDNVIYQFEQQPDGKFLCSGTMNSFEGQPVTRVFRVMPDGALDPSFQAELQSWGEARSYFTLEDGRILVGGWLKLNGSETIRSLIRLHADGSLDETYHLLDIIAEFDPDSPIPSVAGIYRLDDGRFIITGRFDHVDGQVRGGIAMLDADGNLLDDAFTGSGCGVYEYVVPSGSSLYKSLAGIVPAPDGGYYIYGAYHGYDDGTINDPEQRFVSRLYGLNVGVREEVALAQLSVFPNPSDGHFEVRASLPLRNANLALVALTGKTLRTWAWPQGAQQAGFDASGLAAGNYILRLASEERSFHLPLNLTP